MPAKSTQKPAAVKPTTPKPAAKKPNGRPVVFPELMVNGVKITVTTIDFEKAKAIIGYETEPEYTKRRIAEDESLALKGDAVKFGTDFFATNAEGHKVRLSHNGNNREFIERTALGYRQENLMRKWKLNGETIVIGEHGDVTSGQHRLWGYIDAVLLWRKDPYWKKFWPTEPILPCLVVTGADDSEEAIATLDNVRPRTLADTIQTSDTFKDLVLFDKRECSRAMDAAIDIFWKRTGAGLDEHTKFQTHSASHTLLSNHQKLEAAVRYIFEKNKKGRPISFLKLSPGQCAALLYLMAASKTDLATYRRSRTEKNIDFSRWEKAKEFWSMVAEGDKDVYAITEVLAKLVKGDYGIMEVNDKRLAVVVNAWNQWNDGGKVTQKNIEPVLGLNANDEKVMVEFPTVGGIDLGQRPEPEEKEPTPEEVAAEKEKAKEARAAEVIAKAGKQQTASTNPVLQKFNELKTAHPGRLFLIQTSIGWNTFNEDADRVAFTKGGKVKDRPDGMRVYAIPKADDIDELAEILQVKVGKVAFVDVDGETVRDFVTPKRPPLPGKAKASDNGKPVNAAPPKRVVVPPKAKPKLKGGVG